MGARPTYIMNGERIKSILVDRNLTNAEIYGKEGIKRDAFLRALNGNAVLQKTACKIATALNVPLKNIIVF